MHHACRLHQPHVYAPPPSLIISAIAQPGWASGDPFVLMFMPLMSTNDTSFRTFYTGRNLSPQPVLTVHYNIRPLAGVMGHSQRSLC